MSTEASPEAQLEAFIDRYHSAIAAVARAALADLHRRLPGAYRMVYDNYNALVVGFGPTERPSDAVLSVALYPRWVNLFFLKGAALPDPDGVLKGKGNQVRSVTLRDAADLKRPALRTLLELGIASAEPPFPKTPGGSLVIRAIAKKQRPRRP
jgi:hypothetical protein